jgi:hypothetical protein
LLNIDSSIQNIFIRKLPASKIFNKVAPTEHAQAVQLEFDHSHRQPAIMSSYQDSAKRTANDAGNKAQDLGNKAQDKAQDAKGTASDYASSAQDKASEYGSKAKESLGQSKDQAGSTLGDAQVC